MPGVVLDVEKCAACRRARIIDEYVDPAEPRFDRVEYAVDRNRIANISLYWKRDVSNIPDLLCQPRDAPVTTATFRPSLFMLFSTP